MKTIKAKWFECTVRYDKVVEDGTIKKATEIYVADALSFTEAEARVIKEMSPFITGEFEITGVKTAPYREIAFMNIDDVETHFYKVKVAFIVLDEKTGKKKMTNTNILVEGCSLHDALDGVDNVLKGTMADYISVNAVSTKIVDVFTHEN